MDLNNEQKWVAFQAIEEKLFRQSSHIKDLKEAEQTKEMIYHISNLEKDQELLREVRNGLQMDLAMNR